MNQAEQRQRRASRDDSPDQLGDDRRAASSLRGSLVAGRLGAGDLGVLGLWSCVTGHRASVAGDRTLGSRQVIDGGQGRASLGCVIVAVGVSGGIGLEGSVLGTSVLVAAVLRSSMLKTGVLGLVAVRLETVVVLRLGLVLLAVLLEAVELRGCASGEDGGSADDGKEGKGRELHIEYVKMNECG